MNILFLFSLEMVLGEKIITMAAKTYITPSSKYFIKTISLWTLVSYPVCFLLKADGLVYTRCPKTILLPLTFEPLGVANAIRHIFLGSSNFDIVWGFTRIPKYRVVGN